MAAKKRGAPENIGETHKFQVTIVAYSLLGSTANYQPFPTLWEISKARPFDLSGEFIFPLDTLSLTPLTLARGSA